jgi:hypothetical protein
MDSNEKFSFMRKANTDRIESRQHGSIQKQASEELQ